MIIVVSPFSTNPLAIATGHDGVSRIVSIVSGDFNKIKVLKNERNSTDRSTKTRRDQMFSKGLSHVLKQFEMSRETSVCLANVRTVIVLWHSKNWILSLLRLL